MIKNIRTNIITLFFLLVLSFGHLHAAVSNAVFVGSDFIPRQNFKGAELKLFTEYRAQALLSKRLLLVGDFSFNTQNIFNAAYLKNIPSSFNINEISLLYDIRFNTALGKFGIFTGNFEGLGTDIFMRKYLGGKQIDSFILQRWIGFSSIPVIPIHGHGLNLSIQYDSTPLATGFYFYYSNQNNTHILNSDFRLAYVANLISIDVFTGIRLPLTRENKNLTVQQADLHGGIQMLVGDIYGAHLLMQAALVEYTIKFKEKIHLPKLDNVIAFIEPRFNTKNMLIRTSFFLIPLEQLKKLLLVDYQLGAALDFRSNRLYFNGLSGVFGGRAIFSMTKDNYINFTLKKAEIQIMPYAEISFKNDVLRASIQIRPLQYNNMPKFVTLSCSYTMHF